jgi:hypothetical protein
MTYAAEMTSDGIIYIPSFMTIGSVIQVILSVLPREAVVLVLPMKGVLKHPAEIASCGMIYILSLMKIGSRILLVLLMRGIYDVPYWDCLRWHDILVYVPRP